MSQQLRSDRDVLKDDLRQFYKKYYSDELGDFARGYPKDRTHITIDWMDLFRFNQNVAEDYLNDPERIDQLLTEALLEYDFAIPLGFDRETPLDAVDVRVVGLTDEEVLTPLEVVRDEPEGYVAVKGDLAKVTTPAKKITSAAFECTRCGSITEVPQPKDGFQDPHQCKGCERQGPFNMLHKHTGTEFTHYSKVRIETPPDETGDLQNEYIDGFARGQIVWDGHEQFGLSAKTGDSVKVYGTVEYRSKGDKGEKAALFDPYIDIDAIEFESDDDGVNIKAYKDEFEELANRDDAVDIFAESIAPELHATPEWESALELLVAYLFGAPRIDIPEGPTVRGDIHALIISDYGMGKSMVNNAIANYSPKAIKESVTGMSSDVALLAAAVEDDFASGQWTLQPGILVRANGGHVILDEIDKTDVNLERMNNALEGEQVVDINKAGQSATYKSRVGLLATGNPEGSRFDPTVAISEQLDIDQSLLSRFDGIVTMEDRPDEEQDEKVAEAQGKTYIEAFEYQHGDREELDHLDRVVDVDVGRNWIAYARENVFPKPKPKHIETIKEWYASEVRQLNEEFQGAGDGGDMPVPVNARMVMATIRFSVAFARVHLRDEVADVDVERAMELGKKLVGQNFDGEKFVPQESRAPQGDRIDQIKAAIQDMETEYDSGVPVEDIVETVNVQDAKREIDKLKQRGELYEPETGTVRTT